MSIKSRTPCFGVFRIIKNGFQLFILIFPVIISGVKCLRNSSPARISRKYLLFLGSCGSAFCFNGFQCFHRSNIRIESRLRSVYAQIFIGNNVIIFVSIHWRFNFISLNTLPSIQWRLFLSFNRGLNLFGRLCFFHKSISTIYKVSKCHIFRFVEQA